jgi:hypothetical protein
VSSTPAWATELDPASKPKTKKILKIHLVVYFYAYGELSFFKWLLGFEFRALARQACTT